MRLLFLHRGYGGVGGGGVGGARLRRRHPAGEDAGNGRSGRFRAAVSIAVLVVVVFTLNSGAIGGGVRFRETEASDSDVNFVKSSKIQYSEHTDNLEEGAARVGTLFRKLTFVQSVKYALSGEDEGKLPDLTSKATTTFPKRFPGRVSKIIGGQNKHEGFEAQLVDVQHQGVTKKKERNKSERQNVKNKINYKIDVSKSPPNDASTVSHNLMEIPRCGCSKLVPPASRSKSASTLPPHTAENTTCSKEAFESRGAGQKVVAFTYYDPAPDPKTGETVPNKRGREYIKGIRENLDLVKSLYPGWIMRLYFDIRDEKSPALEEICKLACSEPMFDMCDASDNVRLGNASILYPLVWRFLPAIDIQVDTLLSRDLDSRISPREAAAVQEFLASDRDIHVMRDHPAHTAYMMGGMWGAKVDNVRKEMLEAFKKMFEDGIAYAPRHLGGYDQVCLSNFVWRWAKRKAMSHDAYLCHKFARTSPFPTRREMGVVGNYIGSVVSLNGTLEAVPGSECPEKCRPKDHKDWIYC